MNDEVVNGAMEPYNQEPRRFSFYKGATDTLGQRDGATFDWQGAASQVRSSLSEAMNAQNVAFLLGSGCSSLVRSGEQLGIPTMAPLAAEFINQVSAEASDQFVTEEERQIIEEGLGLSLGHAEFGGNLERLMEVLFSFQFGLGRCAGDELARVSTTINRIIEKVSQFVLRSCTTGRFSNDDDTVLQTYLSFYRKLVYRDNSLPRPWVFTTNYDLFNETAMDRLGIPYCNGFSGTVERRFNPASFRYSLAEQLDISNRKWSAVDNFVYLCKFHGSVSWVEDNAGLFPIREVPVLPTGDTRRVMIYPTPAKQNASFGSPYADLFREFQHRIVREQSVLFSLGYGFGDEHVNNIIFQALTVPSFRLIAFLAPETPGIPHQLKVLDDPRVWIIGGDGPQDGERAHYFDTFIREFMPEPPGRRIDSAVERVLESFLSRKDRTEDSGGAN